MKQYNKHIIYYLKERSICFKIIYNELRMCRVFKNTLAIKKIKTVFLGFRIENLGIGEKQNFLSKMT